MRARKMEKSLVYRVTVQIDICVMPVYTSGKMTDWSYGPETYVMGTLLPATPGASVTTSICVSETVLLPSCDFHVPVS